MIPGELAIRRAASVVLAALALSGAARAQAPQLRLPVACEIGRSCIIQQYVDHDPGPGARDYMCGTRVYDGHNGTDIRLPDLAAQRAGVDVLAAADGVVLRTRDGMPDAGFRGAARRALDGRDCGNGVVIDHGGGWQTQYCHLARASLRVRSRERVRAGQRLGRVGLSGRSEFPHLHFTVRHEGTVVDPFAHRPTAGACESGSSLWAEKQRESLAYRDRLVLNVGFAPHPVSMESVEAGVAGRQPMAADAPALVAFVRAVGLKAGDVQRLAMTMPDGRTMVDHTVEALDRHKAQTLVFAGKKRTSPAWPPGTYRAAYTVIHAGTPVLAHAFSASIGAPLQP